MLRILEVNQFMAIVSFLQADRNFRIRSKKSLGQFIKSLFLFEGKELDILHYIFCSDEYLLNINRKFLQHDFYTDIITFDLSETKAGASTGEVYISIDRVKENASTHAVTTNQEFLRVVFHGALHLCGYRDKKKSEITKMREKEDYYLRLFESKFDYV